MPTSLRRVKAIDHPSGERRIVILERSDGLFTFVEEMRQVFQGDPETLRPEYYDDEVPAELFEGLQFECDAEGRRTNVFWTEAHIGIVGLYASADDAESDALARMEGYRSMH